MDKRSVDTWLHPEQFRMGVSTGAPPDYFDPNGQNWGFPTYNWEAMAQDGYAWWKARLTGLAQYDPDWSRPEKRVHQRAASIPWKCWQYQNDMI